MRETTLRIGDDTRVLVLTGAGVSKESGIPTFRDAGGLWKTHPVEAVASLAGFVADPLLVWKFYSERRRGIREALPNAGHAALVVLEARLGDRFLLVTQNIDGLHTHAGSSRVIELHGNLCETKCSVCARPPFADEDLYEDERVPACGKCHARGAFGVLRPNVVWFGEALDKSLLARIEAFVRAAEGRWIFIAIGTSGVVEPAASLVTAARAHGAETWLVNAEPSANVAAFDHFIQGPSAVLLPELLAK